MFRRIPIIRESSESISIQENISTKFKVNDEYNQYSLNKNFFDPTKSSPPNEFMIKLRLRMDKYSQNAIQKK
jgi:hypothetical protein